MCAPNRRARGVVASLDVDKISVEGFEFGVVLFPKPSSVQDPSRPRNRQRVDGTTFDFWRDLRIRYVQPGASDAPADVAGLDVYRDLREL